MLELSVVICSHNPRSGYLRRVLDGLRNQTLSKETWELLLVDNASRARLAAEWDLSWHPNARHVREDRLGIAFARLRGMQEATAETIVFVDDDNVLAPDYLQKAVGIGRKWPMLGVWGSGAIVPDFEVQPAEYMKEYLEMLALREVDKPLWSNMITCSGARPWGAGQCLRSEVAFAYRQFFNDSAIKINSRNSRSDDPFHGGEDVEIGFVACKLGFGVGIFPELKLTHIIPMERLNEDYIVKLWAGIAFCNILLRHKWEGAMPISPFAGLLGIPRVIRNVLTRKGIKRRMYLAELRSQLRARAIVRGQIPGEA